MYIKVDKPEFSSITITLTNKREVEIMLALLLLADNRGYSETNWQIVFKQHNIDNLGNLLSFEDMTRLSVQLNNLLAILNNQLGR